MLIIQMWKGTSNKQYRLSRGYVKTKTNKQINTKVERNYIVIINNMRWQNHFQTYSGDGLFRLGAMVSCII